MTTSTPRSPQGSLAGSRSANTLIVLPPTVISSPVALTSCGSRPRTLSYLSRWASVAVSVRSLTRRLDVRARGEHRAEEVAADAAEAVDANPDGHAVVLLVTLDVAGRTRGPAGYRLLSRGRPYRLIMPGLGPFGRTSEPASG